jgi:hypothetical protein
MKLYSIGIFAVLVLVMTMTTSCNESQEVTESEDAQVEALYEEVMFIHDDVMPKMAAINHFQEKIKAVLADEEILKDDEKTTLLKSLLRDLNDAEKAMWDWMHSFSDSYGQANTKNEKLDYLEKEKEVISAVRDVMLSSIENAEDYFASQNDTGI